MTIRAAAKEGMGAVVRCSGVLGRAQSALAARGWFPVLGYHRVAADPATLADDIALGLAISSREFESHVAHLAATWRVLSVSDARRLAASGGLPAGACAITFDDGWADTYHVAFPILRRHGLTATVFVATDYIDTDRTIPTTRLYRVLLRQARRQGEPPCAARERYRTIKQAGPQTMAATLSMLATEAAADDPGDRMLTWAQLRELSNAGWEIGCHGRSHVSLAGLGPKALLRETAEAKEMLESALGGRADGFCYPQGDRDAAAAAAVRSAGFAYACSSQRGWVRPRGPRFALPRILLGPDTAGGRAAGLSLAMLGAAFARPRRAAHSEAAE